MQHDIPLHTDTERERGCGEEGLLVIYLCLAVERRLPLESDARNVSRSRESPAPDAAATQITTDTASVKRAEKRGSRERGRDGGGLGSCRGTRCQIADGGESSEFPGRQGVVRGATREASQEMQRAEEEDWEGGAQREIGNRHEEVATPRSFSLSPSLSLSQPFRKRRGTIESAKSSSDTGHTLRQEFKAQTLLLIGG